MSMPQNQQQNRQVHPLELKNAINDTQTQLSNLVNTLYKAFEQQNQQLQGMSAQLEKLTPKSAKKINPDMSNAKPKIVVDTKKKKR